MCVLCALNKAKGPLRDLLKEDGADDQDDEIREQETKFLESAGRTSQLATRYIAMLNRLFGNSTSDRYDRSIQRPSSTSLVSSDVQISGSQIPATIQEDVSVFESGTNSSGNMPDLGLTEYDQALYNLGIPVDSFLSAGTDRFLNPNWWGASW